MTAFLDSDTIATVTSVSGVDVAARVESSTISVKTTPSSSLVSGDTDSATVSGKSTPSSTSEITASVDAATIATTTTLTAALETTIETLVVDASYNGLVVGDTVSFVVSSSIIVIDSTTDVPVLPPDPPISVTVTTTDYNNAPLIGAYSYVPGAAIIAGTSASFDNDDGLLDIAG